MVNIYCSDLKKKSQLLRKNMTPQEKHLWYDFLRNHRPQFYRQKPMLTYILDFYCPKAHLGVEIDGSQHFEEQARAYDEKRALDLCGIGIEILRYTNREIDTSFEGVCQSIETAIKERVKLLPRP